MPADWTKRIIGAAALAAIAGGLAWFAWPRPVLVDLATVAKGPIEVTADDDGKTHVRHIYTVSAPIAGKVLRISHPLGEKGPSLHVGDGRGGRPLPSLAVPNCRRADTPAVAAPGLHRREFPWK